MILLLVCIAGGLGAVARFITDSVITSRRHTWLPLGTLVINIGGSFLLGVLTGIAAGSGDGHTAGLSADIRTVLGTGFCGGFTTFSTASIEAVRLVLAHGRRRAAMYAAATLLGALTTATLGLLLGGAMAAAR